MNSELRDAIILVFGIFSSLIGLAGLTSVLVQGTPISPSNVTTFIASAFLAAVGFALLKDILN